MTFFHFWFQSEDWDSSGHGEEMNSLYGELVAQQHCIRDPDVVTGASQHAEGFALLQFPVGSIDVTGSLAAWTQPSHVTCSPGPGTHRGPFYMLV